MIILGIGFKKIIHLEGSRISQKILEGSRGSQKVLEDSRGSQKVLKGSRRSRKVLKGCHKYKVILVKKAKFYIRFMIIFIQKFRY
jgi:hypothetical protein